MIIYNPTQGIQSFGCSRQGSSHKLSSELIPCQDAFLISSGAIEGKSYTFASVADGHGSKKHDRSQIGSHIAMQAVSDSFLGFIRMAVSNEPPHIVKLFKSDFSRILLRKWKDYIKKHLDEIEEPVPQEAEDLRKVYSRYGSTLVFAGVFSGIVFLANLGDGDIIIISNDSNPFEPFSSDEDQIGEETYSLCSMDADKLIKVQTLQNEDVRGIFLSTDGLRKAYETKNGFYNLLEAILKNIDSFNIVEATDILPEHFDHFSANGSGDDITLASIIFNKKHKQPISEPEINTSLDSSQNKETVEEESNGSSSE